MALEYSILSTEAGLQVLTPTTVQDVQVITAQTVKSGLRFTITLPAETWAEGGATTATNFAAGSLEDLVTNCHVVASVPTQEIDANGLLVDYVSLTIAYSQAAQGLPTLYGTVEIPSQWLLQAFAGEIGKAAQACNEEYARLQALAGGTTVAPSTLTATAEIPPPA